MHGRDGGWPSGCYAYNLIPPHFDENADDSRTWTMTGIILTTI